MSATHRPWRFWTVVGATALLLGAATNLAIASYCNVKECRPWVSVTGFAPDGQVWWIETRGPGWSQVCPRPASLCDVGADQHHSVKSAPGYSPWWAEVDERYRGFNIFETSGWPFRAFWACIHLASDDLFATSVPLDPGTVVAGINIASSPAGQPNFDLLPLSPIWPGLLANTAIFSTCWLALFASPRLYVVARGRRRGLCPRCAYDLRHDLAPGCPECGWNRD